mgnify:CR=1 FL=1
MKKLNAFFIESVFIICLDVLLGKVVDYHLMLSDDNIFMPMLSMQI